MAAWRNPAMHRDEIFAGAASTNWMGHGVAVKTSGVMPREGGGIQYIDVGHDWIIRLRG
jgi:hypothetical protein